MADMACYALPPAFAYAFCYYLSFYAITLIQKYPAIPKAGIDVSTTNVISHPVAKAIIKPARRVENVIRSVEIFYPMAP